MVPAVIRRRPHLSYPPSPPWLGRAALSRGRRLVAGRQAHHAVRPDVARGPAARPARAAGWPPPPRLPCRGTARWPGGPRTSVLRGALPGWFRPRCPPAWSQGRTTGSPRGHRRGRRPPSRPLRPAGLPWLSPRWERTARDPPAGTHLATSSPGTSLRTLPAASQAASRPAAWSTRPPARRRQIPAARPGGYPGGALGHLGSVRDRPGQAHGCCHS